MATLVGLQLLISLIIMTSLVSIIFKKKIELELNIRPLNHLPTMFERVQMFKSITGNEIGFKFGDLNNHRFVYNLLKELKPMLLYTMGTAICPTLRLVGQSISLNIIMLLEI